MMSRFARGWLAGRHPWLWHAMFDGTRFCDCDHSRWTRAVSADFGSP